MSPVQMDGEIFESAEAMFDHIERTTPRWRKHVYYPLRRVLKKPGQWKLALVSFWQRGRRGYAEEDTWGFDGYLSRVIAGGVTMLRERQVGHPHEMTMEQWDLTLDEIAHGFRLATKDDRTPSEQHDVDNAFVLFAKHFESLWD